MYSLIRRFEGDYIGFRSFVRLQMCIKAKTIDMISTLHVHKQSGFTRGSPGHCTSLNARNSKGKLRFWLPVFPFFTVQIYAKCSVMQSIVQLVIGLMLHSQPKLHSEFYKFPVTTVQWMGWQTVRPKPLGHSPHWGASMKHSLFPRFNSSVSNAALEGDRSIGCGVIKSCLELRTERLTAEVRYNILIV